MLNLFKFRRPAIVLFELALVALVNFMAFWIRFDGAIPATYISLFQQTLPLVLTIRGITFIPFRLYEGLWRYTSLWDLRNIGAAVLTSSTLIYLTSSFLFRTNYPLSILLIDAVFLVVFMTGIRLARRLYREVGSVASENGILIYGAGDAGELVVRDMKNNPFYRLAPVGFIDDDVTKVGQRIHGVQVLGTRDDLERIIREEKVYEILIAMPNATAGTLRSIVKVLEPFKVSIKTLPNLRDLLDGKVTVSQIRSLALEDLLQRAPIGLDAAPARHLIGGKRVLLTGAGGSIGSELSHQIAAMAPERIVLFERHENSLYAIENDLRSRYPTVQVISVIGDITDNSRVASVFAEHDPNLVFHAAAHKHVPLMESNPCEAVTNNIRGTRILAKLAQQSGVERFILISTDKAVNPCSIMGATKRVAELTLQSMGGPTMFTCVRFGNVLGSTGSVIPRFVEQIAAGGPITVTHREMRRYFMLISEAVQLVLRAAALGGSRAIYVLEMGEEFKVVDLARNLIRLSGYIPGDEIKIVFTGLRPGEKLSEELVGVNETIEEVIPGKVFGVRSPILWDKNALEEQIFLLEKAADDGNGEQVRELLLAIVPTFRPFEANNYHDIAN